jgi:hypothetical protein
MFWAIGTQLLLVNPICTVIFAIVVRQRLSRCFPDNLEDPE